MVRPSLLSSRALRHVAPSQGSEPDLPTLLSKPRPMSTGGGPPLSSGRKVTVAEGQVHSECERHLALSVEEIKQ